MWAVSSYLMMLLFHCLKCCAAFSAINSVLGQGPPKVKLFKANYPLEGGPPQLRLHVAIIVESASTIEMDSTVFEEREAAFRRFVLFDFLPKEPTALPTTFRLLTGQDVEGNLRERELRFLPPGSVCLGESDATLEDMRGFVERYPDRLSLISNNCVTFVDAFVTRHRL